MDPRAEAQVTLEAMNPPGISTLGSQSPKASLPFATRFFFLPRVRVKKAGRKVCWASEDRRRIITGRSGLAGPF